MLPNNCHVACHNTLSAVKSLFFFATSEACRLQLKAKQEIAVLPYHLWHATCNFYITIKQCRKLATCHLPRAQYVELCSNLPYTLAHTVAPINWQQRNVSRFRHFLPHVPHALFMQITRKTNSWCMLATCDVATGKTCCRAQINVFVALVVVAVLWPSTNT